MISIQIMSHISIKQISLWLEGIILSWMITTLNKLDEDEEFLELMNKNNKEYGE